MKGSTTGTWVMSAKFSCSNSTFAWVSHSSPNVVQPSSSSQGVRGGLRLDASGATPSQIQTRPSCSTTGNARTRAPIGTWGWVGTCTQAPSGA